jgi:thioredoxin:protein disulfide reductase
MPVRTVNSQEARQSGVRLGQLAYAALLMLVALLPMPSSAAEFKSQDPLAADDDFLPVDEAFVLSHEVIDGDTLQLRWVMPDGYYLYRHRLGFQTREGSPVLLGDARIPEGKHKVDEFEGDVEVYYHELVVTVPLMGDISGQEIGVRYQGCADAGLCYPPEIRWLPLTDVPVGGTPPAVAEAPAAVAATEDREFVELLEDSGLWSILALFLVAGIGLAFTPCVLPMVPILSSIIVGEGANLSRSRAFTLSLAYVLGMAVTYALIGTLVGFFGAELNLQAKLQSPPVLIFFAIVFVLLSLAMFGFYELALPAGLQDRLQRLSPNKAGGKHISVVVMGAVSSLVVSPCVSAPLAGALVFISQTGDAMLGGSALLALGLGMGLPLLLVGAGGGQLLPRAGEWMNAVKAVFGVLLLGVAVWLVERLVPASVTLALWAVLLIGSGVYLGGLDMTARHGWGQAWKALGFIAIVYGVLLLIGSASGAVNPFRPLASLSMEHSGVKTATVSPQSWQPISNLADLDRELGDAAGRLVVLDLYADWCISCKVMERSVFPTPEVAPLLARFHMTRVDLTANTEEHQALLAKFGLFGPPSLVFFDSSGQELAAVRLQGEVDSAALAQHLKAVLDRYERSQPT